MKRWLIGLVVLLFAAFLPAAPAGADEWGGFEPYTTLPNGGDDAQSVAEGDFNDDGTGDLALLNGIAVGQTDVRIYYGSGGGTLNPVPTVEPLSNFRADTVASGDVNGDGRDDLVVGLDSAGLEVLRQQSDGSFVHEVITSDERASVVRVADVTGDGLDDVVALGHSTTQIDVYEQEFGELALTTYPYVDLGGFNDLELADVDNDGRTDVVTMSGQIYAKAHVQIAYQQPDGSLADGEELWLSQANTNAGGLGVGDVTNDGRNDIVLTAGGNKPSSIISVFAQQTGGGFGSPQSYPAWDIPEPTDIADVNDDGYDDVVVVHGGWDTVSVYSGSAAGLSPSYTMYAVPSASHYAADGLLIADLVGDEAPDVFLADYNNGAVVLENNVPMPSLDVGLEMTGAFTYSGAHEVPASLLTVSTDAFGVSSIAGSFEVGEGGQVTLALNRLFIFPFALGVVQVSPATGEPAHRVLVIAPMTSSETGVTVSGNYLSLTQLFQPGTIDLTVTSDVPF